MVKKTVLNDQAIEVLRNALSEAEHFFDVSKDNLEDARARVERCLKQNFENSVRVDRLREALTDAKRLKS